MTWRRSPSPDGLFWAGVVYLLIGAFGVYFGKALERGGAIDREKNPKQFWVSIALYYLGGISFIGYYFYLVFGSPN